MADSQLLLTCECGKRVSVADPSPGATFACPFCERALTVPKPDGVAVRIGGGPAALGPAESTIGLVRSPGDPAPGTPVPASPPAPAAAQDVTATPSPSLRPAGGTSRFKNPGEPLGPYRVVGLLGKGAMGVVYKAYEEYLDRNVAVKVLSEELSSDPSLAERFRLEAKVAASMSHPNVVHIYAVGRELGRFYFAMEYVAGETVSQELARTGKMSVERSVRIAIDVARGLAAAARSGVIHRDVKPSNILVDEDGHAKIADFGLAKLAKTDSSLTGSGMILGTPFYMSPEQGRGETLDFRADLYSLGATVYHCLAGKPPFQADSPLQVLMQHATVPLKFPGPETDGESWTPELRDIVGRMMAKDPKERYGSYEALITDLETLLPRPVIYSGFFTRLVGTGIDLFLTLTAFILVTGIALGIATILKVPDAHTWVHPLAGVATMALAVLYFVEFQGTGGRTIGKHLMNIQLVDLKGRRPDLRSRLIRFALSPASALLWVIILADFSDVATFMFTWTLAAVGFLGPFASVFHPRGRALHDLIAKTAVVFNFQASRRGR